MSEFDVVPSDLEERLTPGPFTASIPRLAELKARAVGAARRDAVIVAADTMVVVDDDALGKPGDVVEAAAMLRRLRGRAHDVITGVAVLDAASGRTWAVPEITRVVMAAYPDALVDRYVASGAPLDKAGAYAIQDLDGALVAAVIGSYTNVVGLPLALTARLLREAGVPLNAPSSS